jgi:hypothetical protein
VPSWNIGPPESPKHTLFGAWRVPRPSQARPGWARPRPRTEARPCGIAGNGPVTFRLIIGTTSKVRERQDAAGFQADAEASHWALDHRRVDSPRVAMLVMPNPGYGFSSQLAERGDDDATLLTPPARPGPQLGIDVQLMGVGLVARDATRPAADVRVE